MSSVEFFLLKIRSLYIFLNICTPFRDHKKCTYLILIKANFETGFVKGFSLHNSSFKVSVTLSYILILSDFSVKLCKVNLAHTHYPMATKSTQDPLSPLPTDVGNHTSHIVISNGVHQL